MGRDGLRVFVLLLAFKLLLIPAYFSTDLEVHRHWMALTTTFPVAEWYTVAENQTQSQWTLDYPPLFAAYQRVLAAAAESLVPLDEGICRLKFDQSLAKNRLNERKKRVTSGSLLFMRVTVLLISDGILAFAVLRCLRLIESNIEENHTIYFAVLGNTGLLLVDNIHFQYNGLALATFLLSLEALSKEQNVLFGFFLATAVLLKHILMYYIPALGIWVLLRVEYQSWPKMAIGFGLVTLGSLWPFRSDLKSIAIRLFPFGRGLMHSYWAPNVWALWATSDKVLNVLFRSSASRNNNTRGLVGVESHFDILATPSPKVCGALTVLVIALPTLCYLIRTGRQKKTEQTFVELCSLASFSALVSFFFGWHVHEKAILLVSVPLSLIVSVADPPVFSHRCAALLMAVSNLSVGPLLLEAPELPIKFSLAVAHFFVFRLAQPKTSRTSIEDMIFAILCAVSLLPGEGGIFGLLHGFRRLEFLPLMMNSVVCAVVISYVVVWSVKRLLFQTHLISGVTPSKL